MDHDGDDRLIDKPPPRALKDTVPLGSGVFDSEEFVGVLKHVVAYCIRSECYSRYISPTEDLEQEMLEVFYAKFKFAEHLEREPEHRIASIITYLKKTAKTVVDKDQRATSLRVSPSDAFAPESFEALSELGQEQAQSVAKSIRHDLNLLDGSARNILIKKHLPNQTFSTIQQQYAKRGLVLTESAFKMRYMRAERHLREILLADDGLPKQLRERLAAAANGCGDS